ncbi:PR-1-like protein [Clavulina sp. PMI_390]|nr:PR-1-like protein [Clavulina sp. PMI_390]
MAVGVPAERAPVENVTLRAVSPSTHIPSGEHARSLGVEKRVVPSDYLTPHNAARTATGAAALVWDTSLQASAQSWANGCVFEHSGAGENLAAGTGNFDAAAAVQAWVNEASSYDPSNPQPSHWTQVVWKSTTKLGCAVATCSGIFPASYGPAQYHVCHYSPAGNVIGQFP